MLQTDAHQLSVFTSLLSLFSVLVKHFLFLLPSMALPRRTNKIYKRPHLNRPLALPAPPLPTCPEPKLAYGTNFEFNVSITGKVRTCTYTPQSECSCSKSRITVHFQRLEAEGGATPQSPHPFQEQPVQSSVFLPLCIVISVKSFWSLQW